jgi:protein tyrosine phosphatase (PTP) superfamily phosphohydrolase (DUF442 family)
LTTHFSTPGPRLVGSIRNFGWVIPCVLARGEQPELEPETFAALREAGVRGILSLRPDREAPSLNARRPWPVYDLDEERGLAEDHGLNFANVPLQDFSAPAPADLATALRRLDLLMAQADGVYVHCRAGAGRAGLVSGVWSVAHGLSGDEAADNYVRFMQNIFNVATFSLDQIAGFQRRVGQPYVWWALRECVAALGRPVTREQDWPLPPERPSEADAWPTSYAEALLPWRRA